MVKSASKPAQKDPKTAAVWNLGPDALVPAENYHATRLDQPIKLRLSKNNSGTKYPPMSIYTMFKNTVDKYPETVALAYKKDNNWIKISFQEYFNMCKKAAKSFIHLGLKPSHCICLLGFNSPHWLISHLGAIFAGGIGCGVYTTNQAEACEFIFNDCKAQFVVVENKQQLDKIISRRNKLPYIKNVIQYQGEIEDNHNGFVISWQKFLNAGVDVPDSALDARIKTIAPNKCASLIYTSGTTGSPKAAMLSHDSITCNVRHISIEIVKIVPNGERTISYLPLSHIAAQMIDIYSPLCLATTVYFAQPDALKGSLSQTLTEVRPTHFFGVPRVYEKIQEKIAEVLKTLTGPKQSLFQWSSKQAYEQTLRNFSPKHSKSKPSLSYSIAKKAVLDKIHKQLGLEECRTLICGAAPVTKETLEFFIKLGLPISEVFGMSETSGPHTIGVVGNNRMTSVGAVNQYNRSKLINQDSDGSGELCVSGRHVFMGYLNNPEKTKEAFGPNGWLLTGDIAKIDKDGFLYITGRLKELIITAGGENIAPIPVEDALKAELPQLISNCMLVGDKRKYLVILITLKCNINMDTLEPKDELTDDAVKFLKGLNSNSKTVSEVLKTKDKVVHTQIENAIKRANDKATSRAAKVQKFAILPRDFSLFHGELGPTLKLRRPIVAKMYDSIIDELYVEVPGQNAE